MVKTPRKGDPDYLGPFRVLARLGSGGFGTVYAGIHSQSGELAAVKVVHPHLADSDFLARFSRETDAIKRVRSPFVPRFIDEMIADESAWLAVELVPGLSLDKVVAESGPLPEATVWQLGSGIIAALTAIHDAELVHRDLKPQNVLLTPDRPWIIDFGLVHLSDLPHQSSSRLPMATYKYAAPEQLRMGLLGAGVPADVFAAAATLLFAATGHAPHDGESQEALFFQALTAQPNLVGLPPGMFSLIESCLMRSPDARPTLAEFQAEVARHVGRGGGFAVELPRDAIALLGAYQEELADTLQSRGPARLGWGSPPDPDAVAGGGATLRLPEIGELAEAPAPAETRADGVVASAYAEPAGVDAPMPLSSVAPVAVANSARRMSVPDRGARRPPKPGSWTRRFDSVICAPVTVYGDTCLVACLDGTVAALDGRDGSPRWGPVRVGPAVSDAVAVVPGASGGGDVFVASADGGVHVLDLASGRERAVLEGDASIEGAPLAVGNRVYVLRSDGSLHVIDARAGTQRVILVIDGGASGSLAATAGTVFVPDAQGSVHVIDTITGKDLRQLRTAGRVLGAPVPVAGRVFVAGTDAVLRYAGLDADDEREPVALGGAPVHVSPVHEGDVLYVGDAAGLVHAYDISTNGSHVLVRRWRPCPLDAEIVGLAVAGGMVYAATGGQVMELDGTSGVLRRELIRLNCLVGAAPVITGSFAYVVGLAGVVKRLALR